MVIECGDDGFGTDQRTVADCYAALVLKLTAGIDKYVFAEFQILSAIGIKRRKHVRSLGKLSAGQPLHQQLYFFRRAIGVVQLCRNLHRLVGKKGHVLVHLAKCKHLGTVLRDKLTVPMIIVNVDMYTDKLADKDSKTEEQLRYIYDKAIDDVALDLMPYIEANYAVKTGRENTAVAGMSEGGAKSLCTGFKRLDKFGYIAAFAPDTGVIPTEYYKGTFWNTPVFEEFPQPTADTMPKYLYMAVGTKDPWNIDCTLYYRDVLDGMGVKNQTDLVEGYEHNYEFWRQCF